MGLCLSDSLQPPKPDDIAVNKFIMNNFKKLNKKLMNEF